MAKKKETKKKPLKILIDGKEYEAEPRVFKTGRKGYGLYARLVIDNYPHRVSLNIMEM